jgi:hypothetical protein
MTCASFGGKAATARSTPAASALVWASSSGFREVLAVKTVS